MNWADKYKVTRRLMVALSMWMTWLALRFPARESRCRICSPEEAEIDLQVTERSLQMDSTVGALAASADRVTSDASCRAA